ncbi:MAG: carboxylesterase/lipase family protein [Acidobacteria bacterium]|nr:carboxylesterase/lipase family protein [Acidobacteriota bacterium]
MNRRAVLRTLLTGVGALAGAGFVPRPGFAGSAQSSAPVASTASGRIRGFVDTGIAVFKGVRYGADTAPRRFLPPMPPVPWIGVRDALEFGPVAPQPTGEKKWVLGEDCLHLNVWTPGLRDEGKRPVMVWFHPGAYSSDTSNRIETDGVRLSRRGNVVVVTVNHRPNVFGYLYLAEFGGPDLADSGNVGMLDLVLALKWVRDNIVEFGGDPGNVTIFGQSGGGAKCATLMAMPAAAGLFHRVWTMSGQQITASRVTTARTHALQLIEALGIRDRIEELKSLPMEQLVKASRAPRYLGPVKDGRSLSRDPFDPDAPPLSARIPMVLGNTRDETRTLIGRGDPSLFELSWETLVPRLQANSPFMGDLDRAQVIATYRKMYPTSLPADVFFAATTASRSWRGQVIEADRRAASAESARRTWVYQLDWRTPIDSGKWKAHHGLDVPLVFDNASLAPQMVGTGPAAERVADQMSDACIAFARTGNPNTRAIPAWPTFDLSRRATMVFDEISKVVDDPRGGERRLFSQVPYVQPGT